MSVNVSEPLLLLPNRHSQQGQPNVQAELVLLCDPPKSSSEKPAALFSVKTILQTPHVLLNVLIRRRKPFVLSRVYLLKLFSESPFACLGKRLSKTVSVAKRASQTSAAELVCVCA